jgi:ATP-dependent Lhr-like helicase
MNEAPHINPRSWPVLTHQILTICLGHGGVGISTLWQTLSDVPDFADITKAEFYRLIKHLLSEQTLVQLDGRVLLGPKAEVLFGKRNFMTLYAVFSSPQTYSVETKEKHPIGKLAQDFVDQLTDESCFILGGRSWAIDSIRHDERVIKVMPAPSGKQPTWGGVLPQFLSFEVCQKIKSLMLSNDTPRYLKGKALQMYQEEQDDYGSILDSGDLITVDSEQHWYTFAGGQINSTLKHALRAIGSWKGTADNFCLRIKNASFTDVKEAINLMKELHFWSEDGLWKEIVHNLPQYRLSKFQAILPQWSIQEMLADYLLDLPGTWKYLSQDPDALIDTPQITIPVVQPTPIKRRNKTDEYPKELFSSPESQLKLPIHWVRTDAELTSYAEKLSLYSELGVDCETTIPAYRMCLLQIACRDFIILIDPFGISDFTPLKEVLENPETAIIAHSASFEDRQLKKFNIEINNVYDTLKKSRSIRGNTSKTGAKQLHNLRVVCKRELGLNMDKAAQKSNWAQRPLSKEQLMYAALDAEVMLQLFDIFQKEDKKQLNLF